MGQMKRLYQTYAEKAELAVEMYYRLNKEVPLKDICGVMDVPEHIAMTIMWEMNQ